jgi:hypothetical protein
LVRASLISAIVLVFMMSFPLRTVRSQNGLAPISTFAPFSCIRNSHEQHASNKLNALSQSRAIHPPKIARLVVASHQSGAGPDVTIANLLCQRLNLRMVLILAKMNKLDFHQQVSGASLYGSEWLMYKFANLMRSYAYWALFSLEQFLLCRARSGCTRPKAFPFGFAHRNSTIHSCT